MVDSGSDYDVNEAKEKGIAFVPLSITFDNDTYKDGIEISRSEFYKRMREEDIFPKTAQPSPQAFLDVFEEAKANGDQIIGVMLSGGISGTYQSANIAKDMAEYDGKRLIFDSAAKVYRNDYRNYFAEKRSVLQDFCRKFGCQLIEFRTDMEIANNFKIF